MAHDDDKPVAGEDPWAGLEADSQPDAGPDFTFSFDDDAATEEPVAEEPVAEEPVAEEPWADQVVAEEIAFGEPDAALDTLLDGGLDAAPDAAPDSLGAAASPFEDDAADPDVIPSADMFARAAAKGAVDADIDAWLSGGADAETSASSVLAEGSFPESVDEAGELPDFGAGESTVSIGTGTSGIASPSGIAELGEYPVASGDEPDPFAGLTAEADDWSVAEAGDPAALEAAVPSAPDAGDDMFSFMGQSDPANGQDGLLVSGAAEPEMPAVADEADADFGADFDMGAGVAAASAAAATVAAGDSKPGPVKPKRSAPPRKKKPSVVGQLIGVVLGGVLAIPLTLAILIWVFGKDPFNLTPMLPDSVAFLLPAAFQPAGSGTIPNAPSLDDIVGRPATGDGEAALPDPADLATTEPDPLAPVEPEPTDLAAVDPAPGPGDSATEDDPLMNLLDESGDAPPPAPPVEPPPPPEPEPLDLEKLGAAVAEANAALEAVAAVDDPSDPVRRRLTALWYKALAGYAEELAALERLATETGRPFEPASEQADAIRVGLTEHPQLRAELSGLTRAWIAYSKRSSDGVVMPATFVAARRVGPYWRSQVSLAATDKQPAVELVVLTRAEPAVAPGDEVVITGLAVDDNVVWASEWRSAVDGSGFPGL